MRNQNFTKRRLLNGSTQVDADGGRHDVSILQSQVSEAVQALRAKRVPFAVQAAQQQDGGLLGVVANLIVPVALLGGLLFLTVVGFIIFVSLARKKRSLNGTYSPQKLELQAPRLELDFIMKPPNEERLI